MIPDAVERERTATKKAFWQCVGLFLLFIGLTILSHWRPDWLQTALGAVTVVLFILVAIGAQEMWRLRRSNPFP